MRATAQPDSTGRDGVVGRGRGRRGRRRRPSRERCNNPAVRYGAGEPVAPTVSCASPHTPPLSVRIRATHVGRDRVALGDRECPIRGGGLVTSSRGYTPRPRGPVRVPLGPFPTK